MTRYIDKQMEGRFPGPLLDPSRPSTKAEVWTYISHWYGGLIPEDEMRRKAKSKWVFNYVWLVNTKGWDKQPDWVEGDPVIPEACPRGPFYPEVNHAAEVERLWRIARDHHATRRAA